MKKKGKPLGIFVTLLLSSSMVQADEFPRTISAADIIETKYVENIQLSPDGKWATVVTRQNSLEQNKAIEQHWILSTLDKKIGASPLGQLPDGCIGEWAPDSSGLLCPIKEKEGTRLHVLSPWDASDRLWVPWVLGSNKYKYDSFVLSGDRGFLAFTRTVMSNTEESPTDDNLAIEADVFWDYMAKGLPSKRYGGWAWQQAAKQTVLSQDLEVVNLRTGGHYSLSITGQGLSSPAWSPTESSLAFAAAPIAEPVPVRYDFSPFVIDAIIYRVHLDRESGPGKPEVIARNVFQAVQWSPDGRQLAFCDQEGLKIKHLTSRADEELVVPGIMLGDPVYWGKDGKSLVYYDEHLGLGAGIQRANLINHKVIRITPDSDFYSRPLVAASGDYWLGIRSAPNRPPEIVGGSWDRFEITEVIGASALNPQFNGKSFPLVREVSWPSKDRKWTIHGWVLLPPDFNPSVKYPLITIVGGGPGTVEGGFDIGDGIYPTLTFATQGYVVFYPNTRSRGGFGRAFGHAILDEEEYLKGGFQDVMAGVDYLIERGFVDYTRLGIAGFSYGGELASYAITRTSRFGAASIGEGTTDYLRMYYDCGNISCLRWFSESLMAFGSPYDPYDRVKIESNSPLFHVQDVRTPALLEYGINSGAEYQGRPFYLGLQYFGIPSELVVYPRSGHGWTEPKLVDDSYRRNVTWFNFWLKGAEYPDRQRAKYYQTWKEFQRHNGDIRWTNNDIETHNSE